MKKKPLLKLSTLFFLSKKRLCISPDESPGRWKLFAGYRHLGSLLLLLICSATVFAQNITVTGNVKDSKGETLIGVSVRIKGAGAGTATNVDGKYSIVVKDKQAVLIF